MNKRVGIIDNLNNIDDFCLRQIHCADAKQWMHATGGNTGNVAFAYACHLLFKGPSIRIGWGWTPDVVRERVDHIVIACANQLGKHADLGPWADRLQAFGLPVTLIGLGAQTENYERDVQLPSGTIRFLEVVDKLKGAATSANIGVRGQFTKDAMNDIGLTSTITGCPSLFISADANLGCRIAGRSPVSNPRIAVAAGNPWHSKTAFIEKQLVALVDQTRGAYIVQHPESLVQICLGETKTLDERTIHLFLDVLGFASHAEMTDWFRRNAYLFASVPTWSYFMAKFDSVLGPRFHGVALGVQAGIPGLVLAIDNRTKELSETCAVPYLLAEDVSSLSSQKLLAHLCWSKGQGKRFDANRREIASTVKAFVQDNGLSPSDHLTALAAD